MKIERRNAYFCKNCRKVTITVDIDEGVTPFMIQCLNCKGMAQSFMYQLPGCLHINVDADLEWFKPVGDDYKKLSREEKLHVNKGGLVYRKRTDAAPIYKEIQVK